MRSNQLSPERRVELKIIGDMCRKFRNEINISAYSVAKDIGCTQQSIYDFEHGRNDSATIYTWYIAHGMNPVITRAYQSDYDIFDKNNGGV